MRRLLWCYLLFALGPLVASVWSPLIEGRARYGDYKEGVGADALVPVVQGAHGLTFLQGRAYAIRYQQTAGIGIGARRFFRPQLAGGVNLFVDYAHSTAHRDYVQGMLGAELFGRFWEGRINGYWASNRRSLLQSETALVGAPFFDPNSLFILEPFRTTDRFEFVYSGFDGEVGVILPCLCGHVRGYAGGFWWTTKDNPNMAGPRLRAVYETKHAAGRCICSRFFFGAEWQYDQVRKTQAAFFGGIRITGRGPRDCCPKSSICRRMGELVRREPINLVREAREQDFACPFIGPDGPIGIFFIEQDGTGIGTQVDPTNILDAQLRSGPGDFIFALADNGVITYANQGVNTYSMQDRQSFIGFGDETSVTITVDGFPITINAIGPAGRGTLQGVGGNDMIVAANDNLFQGIALNEGQNGISGTGIANATINDILFDMQMGSGLAFMQAMNVGGDAIQITNATGPAVTFTDPSGVYPFSNANWTDNGGGMNVIGGSANIAVADSLIEDVGNTLLMVTGGENEINWAGTFNDINGQGVVVANTTGGAVALDNVSVQTPIGSGVTLTSNAGNFSLTNSAITDAGATAIDVFGGSGTYLFDNVDVTGASGAGATFELSSAAFTLTNSSWSNNIGGMDVTDGLGTIDVTNSTIDDVGNLLLIVVGGANEINWSGSAFTNINGLGVVVAQTTGGAVNLDSAAITTPLGSAITLTNNAGDFSYDNGSITFAPAVAVDINGGSGNITFDGTSISQGAIPLVDIDSTTGGEIQFINGSLMQIGGPSAISATTAVADVRVDNLSATGFTADPVVVTNSTGNYILSNTTIQGTPTPANTGINVTGHTGDVSIIDGGESTGFNSAIAFFGDGQLTVAGSSLANPFTVGGVQFHIRADMMGNDLVLDFINQPMPTTTASNDYTITTAGNIDMTNTVYQIDPFGLILLTGFQATSATSGTFNWNFDSNTLTTVGEGGYRYTFTQAGSAQVSASLTNHLATVVGAATFSGFQIITNSTATTMSVVARDNVLSGGGGVFTAPFNHNTGVLDLTVEDNLLPGAGALIVTNAAAGTITLDERTNQATPYNITNNAAQANFTLTGLAAGAINNSAQLNTALSSLGNLNSAGGAGITTNLTGTITSAP